MARQVKHWDHLTRLEIDDVCDLKSRGRRKKEEGERYTYISNGRGI
jgi:hypothetical protein